VRLGLTPTPLSLFNAPHASDMAALGLGGAAALAFLGGGLVSVAGPNLRATMLNVSRPVFCTHAPVFGKHTLAA
jgi:hypothetical protein